MEPVQPLHRGFQESIKLMFELNTITIMVWQELVMAGSGKKYEMAELGL